MPRATVSGSFHRHMHAIQNAVHELTTRGVEVLSPADPRVVDFEGEFLFVASDKLRSVRLVQDRHFAAIGHSDFLWIVCPDGYTGPSTCMEIGDASRAGVPIYSDTLPLDITIREYVTLVPDLTAAINLCNVPRFGSTRYDHIFLTPAPTVARTIDALTDIGDILAGKTSNKATAAKDFGTRRSQVAEALGLYTDRKKR